MCRIGLLFLQKVPWVFVVKLLSSIGICFLILSIATFQYYDPTESRVVCQYRILTSNSFHSSIGQSIKQKYREKYGCELNFAVVNGAKLISSLYNKQPKQYDILLGLDLFQIQNLSAQLIYKFDVKKLQIPNPYRHSYFAYDEAPITFFLRNSSSTQFDDLKNFFEFLNKNGMSVAIPLKTTSVLGALFEKWVIISNIVNGDGSVLKTVKYVKSWSESLGLFERKIVDGFLSFETSQIYFLNNKNIKKITLNSGHPNLKEYLAFSKFSKMRQDQKKEFIEFIHSKEIQDLILKKNYMWPISRQEHEYPDLRTLRVIDLEDIVN